MKNTILIIILIFPFCQVPNNTVQFEIQEKKYSLLGECYLFGEHYGEKMVGLKIMMHFKSDSSSNKIGLIINCDGKTNTDTFKIFKNKNRQIEVFTASLYKDKILYERCNDSKGTFILTRLDTLNNTLSGEFDFTLCNKEGNQIEIKNGVINNMQVKGDELKTLVRFRKKYKK